MSAPTEESPLVPKPKLKWDAIKSFFQIYEPVDEFYQADNPSPLMLLGMHLGLALIQMMSMLGSYITLCANARVLFPRCSDHSIIDYVFGLHTKTGLLCELFSLLLWTFPLICCALIPFFEYWDFCDSRLYYECLRARVVIQWPDKDILTSPFFYIILAYLLLGMLIVFFGRIDSIEAWHNLCKALVPFLLPVLSFGAKMYAEWDLKYFLITMPLFTKKLRWAQTHLANCTSATEWHLRKAYHRKAESGFRGASSHEIMDEIREEVIAVIRERASTPGRYQLQRKARGKAYALLCGGRGWWIADLLFLPQDPRAAHFRVAFRLFAMVCTLTLIIMAYLLASTFVHHQDLQGHVYVQLAVPWIAPLQDLSIEHPHHG